MAKTNKLLCLMLGIVMSVCLIFGITLSTPTVANAADTTYTMTIDSSNKGKNNVHWTATTITSLTYNNVTWTTSVTGTTSVTASTTYAQIGSQNNPATKVTLSTSAFAGKKIKSVSLTGYCMSNTGPTLTVKAGSTTIINNVALVKTTSTEYKTADSFEGVILGASDALTFEINSSAKAAICISKIEVKYAENDTPAPEHVHNFTGDYVKGEGENEGKHTRKCVNDGCDVYGYMDGDTAKEGWQAHDFSNGDCVCGAKKPKPEATYTSDVELTTTGGTNASAAKVVIDGHEYDAIKAGTSSKAGIVQVTIPANTKTLHFHAAGWNGETVTLDVNGTEYALVADSGVAGNSPFTLQNDPATQNYFSFDPKGATTITFTASTTTAGKRFVLFEVKAEIPCSHTTATVTHVEAKSATCIANGHKEHWHCATCDTYYSDADLTTETTLEEVTITSKGTEHDYSVSNHDADHHWMKCQYCNEVDSSSIADHVFDQDGDTKCVCGQEKPSHEHTWDKGEVTVTPTCLVEGELTKHCTYPDCEETLTENLGYGDHDTEWFDEIPATCTKDGVKAHSHCSVCNKNFDKDGNEITDLKINQKQQTTYRLVTNADDLKDGDTIVLGCQSKNVVAGAFEDKYLKKEEATFNNDKTVTFDTAQEIVLIQKGTNWVLSIDGKQLKCIAKSISEVTDSGTALTISIANDGTATISTGSETFKYNASSPRFVPYASGQTDIQIYKKYPAECKAGEELFHDDNNHWQVCSTCGAKMNETAHNFTTPNHDETNHWKECECGAKANVTAHNFTGEWLKDNDYHWKECECGQIGNKAQHYYGAEGTNEYCECGNRNPSACNHTPSIHVDGVAKTCYEDGYEDYYTCDCGTHYFASENVADTIANIDDWKAGAGKIPASHDYGKIVLEAQPTCASAGMKAHYYCETCETYFFSNKQPATKDDLIIPINPDAHKLGKFTELDHEYHYAVCPDCQATVTEEHDFSENKCVICGADEYYKKGVQIVEKALADIKETDKVIITMAKDKAVYALPNGTATTAAPKVKAVTVKDGKITSETDDTMYWTIEATTTGGYHIHNVNNYLNITNANDGVRVGKDKSVFSIDKDYLMANDGTNDRYIGVYNSAEWRCYKLNSGKIADNIKDQTLAFYVEETLWIKASEATGEDIPSKIYGRQLELGEDITLYVTAYYYGEGTPEMKFNLAGKNITASGEKVQGVENKYKFAYRGLAPHLLGNNVTATLADETGDLDTKEFTARAYLEYLYNNNEDTKNVVAHLLNYGAAAQSYIYENDPSFGYKVNFVNDRDLEPTETYEDAVDSYGRASIEDGTEFTAVSVYFSYTNGMSFYFKVNGEKENYSIDVRVKDSAESKEIALSSLPMKDGEYVYSFTVSPKDISTIYQIRIKNGDTFVAVIQYSMETYVARVGEGDGTMGNLAKALYSYCLATKDYSATLEEQGE